MKKQTLTLDNLSDCEIELYNEVMSIKGHSDYKMQILEEKRIFEHYKNIHKSYFNLIVSSTDDKIKLEALKRAYFLNWYSFLEPSWLTGIYQLDSDIYFNIYKILNDYLKRETIDNELKYMLAYSSKWKHIIFACIEDELPEFKSFIQTVDQPLLKTSKAELAKTEMTNRGQMGLHLRSMADIWRNNS